MNGSRMGVTAVAGGVVVMLMLGFVTLTGLSASLAWSQSGGYGGGPGICQSVTVTPGAGSPTPGSSRTPPSPTATAPGCVPASKIGAQVVALARAMADALYVNPACGGHISYPDCYYTWYKAPGSTYPPGLPAFPQAVITYGQQVCPGCAAWANGDYQCVSFVRGAYSQVYPMTLTANAFNLWATYAGQPGWQEIPSAAAPAQQRSLPMPGDVMIFKDTSIGHAAIVMSVLLPTASMDGAITFSNSNSVSPYTTMPLLPDLTVDTSSWPGYSVWGYIRPAGTSLVPATPASGQLAA
jgi:CHAP domain-containing protein